MVRAEGLLQDRQRALVERLGLPVLALGVIELSQVLFRLVATSGWSGPRAFSRIASARLWSGSACPYWPWAA
jgi:hypothetical protein